MTCAVGRAQLPQSLSLNLADPLAGDIELLSDFFESVFALTANSEAKPDDLLLFRRERFEDVGGFVANIRIDNGVDRRPDPAIFDEIAQSGFAIPSDRR